MTRNARRRLMTERSERMSEEASYHLNGYIPRSLSSCTCCAFGLCLCATSDDDFVRFCLLLNPTHNPVWITFCPVNLIGLLDKKTKISALRRFFTLFINGAQIQRQQGYPMYIQNASPFVSYRSPCKGISSPLIPLSWLRLDTSANASRNDNKLPSRSPFAVIQFFCG